MKSMLALSLGIGLLATGVIAQDAKPGTVDELIEELAGTNPLLHAVVTDHIDEAREINPMILAGNEEAAEKALAALVVKYGSSALSRASDAAAIEVIKKGGEVIDVLAEQHPEGCLEFVRNDVSLKALSYPRVEQSYRNYLEAQRIAYEDGKSRAPIARMELGVMFEVVTEDLGVSRSDMHTVLNPGNTPAAQLCSLIRKDFNVEAVRESQRGAYARANLSSKK
ncbi:hypothetical protein [Rhizobium leguminosarum]|uniref:hypothetical protein n=1 Tax=Rhizobium leguminosarum TaxID=384 RepID=UPI00140FEA33|nr:hypothetical protein [Rhizobium leguminosarum]QIO56348.1 hypothetical protein HA463_00880 [Rhizobium leguminosarum bv. trifolii]